MTQNIKEWLQQGEKEFEEWANGLRARKGEELYNPEAPIKYLKQFIFSRQISLIKMIVDRWLELNLRNDNKENWDKELTKFGLFMQGLKELTDGK